MSTLPLFSKTLFYAREYHPVEIAGPRARALLVGALQAVAAQERDVTITRNVVDPLHSLTLTINGQQCAVDVEAVNAAWNLRSELQKALQFVQGHLGPAAPGVDPNARFVAIEIAATNGMLSALDDGSVLLDVEAYRAFRARLPTEQIGARADGGGVRPRGAAAAGASAAAPPAIASRLAAPGTAVGYLRLPSFDPGVSAEVKRGLARFESERVKGWVLDLRNNTGGLLEEAIAVADAFIKQGTLGSSVSKERGTQQRKEFVARNDGHEPGGGLVVLVDHDTASASELVAAAIKNLGRGVVLGEPTAGSASVRVIFDISKARLGTTPSRPPASSSSDFIQDVIDGKEPTPPPTPPPAPVQPDTDELLGLLLKTGRLRAAGDGEIEGAGVIPDVASPCVAGPRSRPEDDCLVQLALKAVARARDGARATLLSVAKELATAAPPPPSTPL